MFIRYRADNRIQGAFVPPGTSGFATFLFGNEMNQGHYKGMLYLPNGQTVARQIACLHEIAHALQFNELGLTHDAYKANPCNYETEAWAIALQWVPRPKYRRAFNYAVRCLGTYFRRYYGAAELAPYALAKRVACWQTEWSK